MDTPPVWGNEAVDPLRYAQLQDAKQKRQQLMLQLIPTVLLVVAFSALAGLVITENWPAFWIAALLTTLIVAWMAVGAVKRFYDYYFNNMR